MAANFPSLGLLARRASFVVASALLLSLPASASALQGGAMPQAERVDRQPLLAQVQRVAETLEQLGSPLTNEALSELAAIKELQDDAEATRRVQALLDPLCLAALEVVREGVPTASPGPAARTLGEQSWRTYLVKVVNPDGLDGPLVVSSPNAQPIPRSPAEEVRSRWMELSPVEKPPMKRNLSGLPLEYRVIQIAGYSVGKRAGELVFVVGEGEQATAPRKLSLDFEIAPAAEVRFRVSDEKGQPTIACFEIRDASGAIYPARSKRLAPDFFFQRQVYRKDGETLSLPVGRYSVVCSRGPESIPETRELVVNEGINEFAYKVARWIDPSVRGYWSGDHHIHAAGCQHYENPTQGVHPEDMFRHIVGEDLKVGCCLTWGPCFDFQKRFFTGAVAEQSQYPYLLRYDVEVSGFGSHQSGHLNLLNLQEQIYPGGESKDHWPTLGLNTLRWAKRQGAVCGPAHSANGLTRTVGRVPKTEGLDGPGGLPSFDVPAYDGIGANEFIVDVTHEVEGPDGAPVPAVDFISAMDTDRKAEWNMWYHVLNCGYRVAVSGETDFPCIYGERVGIGRVYARVEGELTFDAWVQALGRGESYVSDGSCHLMDFQVTTDANDSAAASAGGENVVFSGGSAYVLVTVAARREGAPALPVELIVNGYPVAEQKVPADGEQRTLKFQAKLDKSSWIAVRVTPHAHTNPVYVLVDDKPIRANAASARWCLAGIEQCWLTKQKTYAEAEQADAVAAYEHARQAFRRILAEHEGN